MTKRTRVILIAGLVAVVAAVAAVVVIERADRPDFEIDLGNPAIAADSRLPLEWVPRVHNNRDTPATGVQLRFGFSEPGGGFPPVLFDDHAFEMDDECGVEDPGPHPECEDVAETRDRQDCALAQPVGEDGYYGRSIDCAGDIPAGTHRYEFSFGLGPVSLPDEAERLDGYPEVRVRAELSSNGTVLASAEQTVAVEV